MMVTSEDTTPVARLAPAAEPLDHLIRHRSDDAAWFAEVEANLLAFRSTLVTHTPGSYTHLTRPTSDLV